MPPIDHVVVLMMENACFDRMIGCMAEVHPGLDGVDPAHPRSNPDGPGGPLVFQGPTTTRTIERDPKHFLPNSLAQLDGGTNRGLRHRFRPHPPDQHRRAAAGGDGLLPARLPAWSAHARRALRGLRPLVLLVARTDLEQPPVRPQRHVARLCRGTARPVHLRPAPLQRTHVVRRAVGGQGALAHLLRRRAAIAGDDAPVPAPPPLPPLQAFQGRCRGRRLAGVQLHRTELFRPRPERPAPAGRRDARRCPDRRGVQRAPRQPRLVRPHAADRSLRRARGFLRPCAAAADGAARRAYGALQLRPSGLPRAGGTGFPDA